MKDLGTIKRFLSIDVERKGTGKRKISQKEYIKEIELQYKKLQYEKFKKIADIKSSVIRLHQQPGYKMA